jgi:hypothetical protein
MRIHKKIDTFTNSGTWTCPEGVDSILVECWGSGGGGTTDTGAGGGGAFASKIISVTPSTEYDVVVGSFANPNVDGNSSYFDNETIVKAAGGKAGGNGGIGGAITDSIGTTRYAGGNGEQGEGNKHGGASAGSEGSASETTAGINNGPGAHMSSIMDGRMWGVGGGSSSSGQRVGSYGLVKINYDIEAPEGFPYIKSRNWSRVTTNTTSHEVRLPSGISEGDLLIFIFACDGAPTFTDPEGWTKLIEDANSTTTKSVVYYKIAGESESDPTITTSGSEKSTHISLCIADVGGIPKAAAANGSSTNANPPELDTEIVKNYLWITAAGWDWNTTTGLARINSQPTGYESFFIQPCANENDSTITAISEKFLRAEIENPGTFTSTSEQWVAFTIAVPAALVKLETPGNLSNSNIRADSFTASWGSVVDAEEYVIELHGNASFTDLIETETLSTTHKNFSGLSPKTQYWWRVKAIADGFEESDFADSSVTTLSVYVPPKVTKFVGDSRGPRVDNYSLLRDQQNALAQKRRDEERTKRQMEADMRRQAAWQGFVKRNKNILN